MYKKIIPNVNSTVELCQALCYFEESWACKIVVHDDPNCFFGNPFNNYSYFASLSNQTVYGNYGEAFSLKFEIVLL
jgi:hypothetical protein